MSLIDPPMTNQGFIFGDKNEAGWYDGKNLATSRNVVVVEPNCRQRFL